MRNAGEIPCQRLQSDDMEVGENTWDLHKGSYDSGTVHEMCTGLFFQYRLSEIKGGQLFTSAKKPKHSNQNSIVNGVPHFQIASQVSFFLSEKLHNVIQKHIKKVARIAEHRCEHSYKDHRLGFFSLAKEAIKGDTKGMYEIVEAMHKVKRKLSLSHAQ